MLSAIVLGAAAGGGLPQWNCNCPTCRAAREGGAVPRTQSSLAVRAGGGPWVLVNASPDVRQQLELLREGGGPVRGSPVAAVLLTDAELDHVTGLIVLREGDTPLRIYASAAVRAALTDGFPVLRVLEHYCGVDWQPFEPGETAELEPGLLVEAFAVPGDPPRYVGRDAEPFGVGLTFRAHGAALTYVPAVARFDDDLVARLGGSDVALVDGTCWADDEMPALGIAGPTAREMGHAPLSGPGGSLEVLRSLPCRTVLVHVNNTNPILQEASAERHEILAAGIDVAYDGMRIELGGA
jgi:pyrroloquinoline quinone biosynthesis protein B